ncbi:MAG: hypothetical protein WC045_00745 [Patescibacteria group bacterium]
MKTLVIGVSAFLLVWGAIELWELSLAQSNPNSRKRPFPPLGDPTPEFAGD